MSRVRNTPPPQKKRPGVPGPSRANQTSLLALLPDDETAMKYSESSLFDLKVDDVLSAVSESSIVEQYSTLGTILRPKHLTPLT